ncbi:deoxynucleoside kinase [Corallococcus exercitus]|uniref:Deoxynucleoside kinase n=1 Tax=Corallococcus exercitus TaxID=2316736 RepID=A0A3A8HZK5_9BACT|nr:deoxynucleoside kinase [Corallococcus exercitus]NOK36216.1 deoxynucleoside kinase [Corallococcus exercitus]RKG72890.1 deoxynucleoside kinase [Corallococcus exercitus]
MPRSTARARPATSRTEPPPSKAPPTDGAEPKPSARNTLKLKVKVPRAKRFVALAGNIGAGKTTAAKLISQGFGFELFDEPVIDNRFLRDYYGDMSRWSFTLQLEFLIRRVEHHELIHSVRKSCVQDRTLYEDPEIFAKYLHGLGHMTNAELDLYYEYFQRLSRHIVRPDKVICFDVPSEDVLLQRIRTRGRAEEKGIGRQFLKGLNGYYAGFPQVLQEKYGVDCLVVDVSKQDIRRGQGREEFMDRVSAFLA